VEQMAVVLEMTTDAYAEWERPGRRQWQRINMPLKVAEATNVSIDWLLLTGSARQPVGADGKTMPPGPSLYLFLRLVRRLPSEAQNALVPATQAVAERWPAVEAREAALRLFTATGAPDADARADAWMATFFKADAQPSAA